MSEETRIEKKRRATGAIIASNLRGNYCHYLSFLVVFTVFLAVMVAEQIEPFGGKSLTLVDSLHQYIPFYSEYRDKLLTGRGLSYSFNVALGSNFSSLFAYYLSSPFNIILLLVPKRAIIAVVNLTMAVKVSLAALFMSVLLVNYNKKKRIQDPLVIGIAVSYALSNYMIGYFWNTMWLDAIMVFPLIILGFKRMEDEKKPLLYTLTLAYALFCNYYIAYMICAFLVLWFLFYEHKGFKAFFINGLRFALYSVTAACLAACVLIPAFLGIRATAAGSPTTTAYKSGLGKLFGLPKHEWYGSIWKLLKQQLFMSKPITNQTFDGGVNLYCGMIVILTTALYLIGAKTKLWQKLRYAVLLSFLMVSFNETTLNYIWHGMHDQYGIPNRFSFLFIFVLLFAAYEMLSQIPKTHPWFVIFSMIPAAVYVFVLKVKNENAVSKGVMIGSVICLIVYALILMLATTQLLKKKLYRWVMSIAIVAEIVVNGVFGFSEIGYADYAGKYSTLPEMQATVDYMKKTAQEKGQTFYRAEVMKHRVLDEVTFYNLPSVSTFNSTVGGDIVELMGRIGFYTGANEFLYMGSTPFTNSILGVRYVLERQDDLNNFSFNYSDNPAGVVIYENPCPLSIGFAVDEAVRNWDSYPGTPIKRQQELAYDMTGQPAFFNVVYPDLTFSSDNMDIGEPSRDVTVTPQNSGAADFTMSFTAQEDGDYYINCRGNYITKIRFYVDGKPIAYDRYQVQIFHLGYLTAGQKVNVQYEYDDLKIEPVVAHFEIAIFDRAEYQKTYEKLAEHQLQVETFEDGHVKGTIDMPLGKTLFTSIPYDKGWKLTVDGKDAEYYKFGGALIGIDLAPGTHEIELKYTPPGKKLGWLLTVLAILFLVLRAVLPPIFQKNKIKNLDSADIKYY